jgi:hypothetical protein
MAGIRDLQLIINAAYKGGKAFKQAQSDIAKTEKDAEKTGRTIKTSFKEIGIAAGAVGVAFGALAVAGKVAWDTLNEGAQLELARDRFDNLSASINTTGDALLGKLRDATNGMISDAQLISSATDMMSLGLAKTEEQAVRLTTVVGKLGWDMQQVVLTMANNSKMRLDALGLSVEDVDRRVEALVATGMTMDEAFDTAVLEAGEDKIKLLGDAADTTAGQIQILVTAVQNVQDEFKRGFAEGFAESLKQVGVSAEAAGAGAADMSYGFGNFLSSAAVGMTEWTNELYHALGLDLVPVIFELAAVFGIAKGSMESATRPPGICIRQRNIDYAKGG